MMEVAGNAAAFPTPMPNGDSRVVQSTCRIDQVLSERGGEHEHRGRRSRESAPGTYLNAKSVVSENTGEPMTEDLRWA